MKKQSQLLEAAVESLDIPDYLHDAAVVKYNEISDWLVAEDSELKGTRPEIYPQGSFRLGTVVRPYGKEDQYDIDLVCRLSYQKDSITKAELKKKIGDRLKKNDEFRPILNESRRAWTLTYPHQFHLDVLSSIPNIEQPPNGILLPDKQLHLWQKSNPISYADWFYSSMRVVFNEKRAAAARLLEATVDDVPEWQVKTPLQRVIQILKRHRDIYFANQFGVRPVSIIITTLAARAYRNQPEIIDALVDVLQSMPRYIEQRGDKWWVPNPVEPDENFAERWNEYPQRREAFYSWMEKAKYDFITANRTDNLQKLAEDMAPSLGYRTITKAAVSLGVNIHSTGVALSGSLPVGNQVPGLASTSHCAAPMWPIVITHKASLKGTVHRKLYQGKILWGLTNRPVPKKLALRFMLSTNVPPPYEVRWQVVNTGIEAFEDGQLRGGFEDVDDRNQDVRWESTKYAGTHWIEAFVIKNGKCVARTGPKKVLIRDR